MIFRLLNALAQPMPTSRVDSAPANGNSRRPLSTGYGRARRRRTRPTPIRSAHVVEAFSAGGVSAAEPLGERQGPLSLLGRDRDGKRGGDLGRGETALRRGSDQF